MPTQTRSARPRFRLLATAAATLLLAAGGLLVAPPAVAHDELVSTDPAADSVVDAVPAELNLTFSGELAIDPGATELQVTDAAGTSLTGGDPVVEGTEVTQALAGTASGTVTVLWKVVSSDGHPISGEYSFTVAAPPTPTPTPTTTASPTPTETPSAAPTTVPTEAPTETPQPAASNASALPWIIGGLLLLAVVVAAVTYLLVSRARRARAQQALREEAASAARGASGSDSAPPADL